MTQTLSKLVTFEQFIEWYPSNGVRHELHKGFIVDVTQPVQNCLYTFVLIHLKSNISLSILFWAFLLLYLFKQL